MSRVDSSEGMDDMEDDIGMDGAVEEISNGLLEVVAGKDEAEMRSVTSRCRIREQLNADVEAYLASGGCISHVDTHLVVLPQRRSAGEFDSRLN